MASSLNLGTIKTPGVYLDEMSLFPPSVAQVDTAIPAFIGLTRQSYSPGQPVRIGSMAEFRSFYGGGPDRNLTVQLDAGNVPQAITPQVPRYLFDSLQLFFSNGGEKCYIVSIGTYDAAPAPADMPDLYQGALDALRKFDEPTLIVMPDAVALSPTALPGVQQAALDHCRAMQDRFAILDVQDVPGKDAAGDAGDFRKGVTGNLTYGAAYYPYLQTSLPLTLDYGNIRLQKGTTVVPVQALVSTDTAAAAAVTTLDNLTADRATILAAVPTVAGFNAAAAISVEEAKNYLISHLHKFHGASGATNTSPGLHDADLATTYNGYVNDPARVTIYNPLGTDIGNANSVEALAAYLAVVADYVNGFVPKLTARYQAAEAALRAKAPVYATIMSAAETRGIVLPPSGAVAGVYARVDGERGVWKSPANVGLNYVSGPAVALTDADQDGLNVDPVAGKSINAIRAFSGKGTLVWGARTLAGSDNEWRYVSVRRFFLMAEESIKKATAQFVFEANDANTWVRIRAMIENFLTLQWRAGALAGTKAENAFFVRVGLGQTMTPQDVLNGFMIIEIGLAVVRPAEFIVLRFSHKMQEA